MTDLFNSKTINRLCENVIITESIQIASKKWLEMLKQNKLEDEESNYIRFFQIILQQILGYDSDDIKFEKNNVEFQILDADKNTILCCETKGTKVKDLYAYQHYYKEEHKTPISQAQYYAYRLNLEYGMCTNYKTFILFDRNGNTYEFDFESIGGKDSELKLKEFVGLFSKSKLQNGILTQIRTDSIVEEREFTEAFYKLYHETRLMMIKEFREQNGAEQTLSIHLTQIILNRLIFIFFAGDRGLISDKRFFYNRISKILKLNIITDTSQKIFDDIKDIFTAFDKGSNRPKIFSFNGGLFNGKIPNSIHFQDINDYDFFKELIQNSKFSKLKLDDEIEIIIKEVGNLNPIIKNLMIMESFDFNTEVSINILGHIFEQSISDLESLENKTEFTRKESGVYYTPEYITEYICRNTIIPYLSKSKKMTDVLSLIEEYGNDNDISSLEKQIKEIKILDPACGSGAFLLKSIDVLLEIGKMIQDYKRSNKEYYIEQQSLVTQWNEELEIEQIVENNIYGVDIYQQSIDVVKLSLCLRVLSRNKKLPDFGKNIIVGNSLISDKVGTINAVNWEQTFPAIFKSKTLDTGFDIILGNPPYVQYKIFKKDVDYMQLPQNHTLILPKNFKIPPMSDLSFYFFYHSLNLLTQDGKLGFIMTDTWLQVNAGRALRKAILDNTVMKIIFKMTYNVFGDALVKTTISIFDKNTKIKDNKVRLDTITDEYLLQQPNLSTMIKPQSEFNDEKWLSYFDDELPNPKIKMYPLVDLGIVKKGILTGYNPFFIIDDKTKERNSISEKYLVPVVSKSVSGCYLDDNDAHTYLLKVNESKGALNKTKEGRLVLKYIQNGESTKVQAKGTNQLQNIPQLYNLIRRKSWYSLSLKTPSPILVRRTIHKFPTIYENNDKFYVTDGYIEFQPNNCEYIEMYLAYMTSSFFASQLEDIGHAAGGGALSLVPNNLKDALSPDFDKMDKKSRDMLKNAWKKYRVDLDREQLNYVVCIILGLENKQKVINKRLSTQMKRRMI